MLRNDYLLDFDNILFNKTQAFVIKITIIQINQNMT